MIMINGNWEQVKNLSDILRIVSENISDEFAKKVEEIFSEHEQKFTQNLESLRTDLRECKNLIDRMKELMKIT